MTTRRPAPITISGAESADATELARRMIDALRSHNIVLAKELADTIERELDERRRTDY